MEYAALVSRWLHIIPAIVLVGGTVFMRFALLPAASDEDERTTALLADVRNRWAKLIMISAFLLILSGVFNVAYIMMNYEVSPARYHGLLTGKIVLAFAIFFLSSVLAGRSDAAKRWRENEAKWLTINMLLAIVLVCLAGVMKFTDRTPKESTSTFHVTTITTETV